MRMVWIALLTFVLAMVSRSTADAYVESSVIPHSNKDVQNVRGSYAHFVKRGSTFQYFSNARPSGASAEGVQMWEGTDPRNPRFVKTVAPNSIIDDLFDSSGGLDRARMFTRGVTAFSEKDQRYYSVVHVSRGYPPTDGKVVPALIVSKTSNPRDGFKYLGRFKGEAANYRGWTSGMTFFVNDAHDAVVNHVDPLRNKFVFYNEAKGGIGVFYSNDGLTWSVLKDSNGRFVDIRPPAYRGQNKGWIFNSGVKTKDGIFIYVSYDWTDQGPVGHRLLYSKNGIDFKVIGVPESASSLAPLETKVAGKKRPKNVTLGYEPSSNDVFVLVTTGSGGSYEKGLTKFQARSFATGASPNPQPSTSPLPKPSPSPSPTPRPTPVSGGAGTGAPGSYCGMVISIFGFSITIPCR